MVENRTQAQVAFGGAKRGLGLRELDIPAPQQCGVGLLAVGAQQIRAFLAVRVLAGLKLAGDLQTAGVALGIVLHLGLQDAGGGGVFPQMATNAPAHGFEIVLGPTTEPRVDLHQFAGESLALAGEHRPLLLGARAAAAKHIAFARFTVGVFDQADF